MTHKNGKKCNVRSVVVVAAAIAVLCCTAVAAVYHGGFFNHVFGKGVAGQEAFTETVTDKDGNIVKTVQYPTVERVEVDEEKAENLVGAYVTAVGQSVTLENYTFTLEDVLLDENGIGALTVHVENPDGHDLKQSGQYYAADGEHPPFSIRIERQNGDQMDTRDYLVTNSFTQTEATFVCYITPFEPLPIDETLTLCILLWSDSEFAADWPSAEITIPASEKIPACAFSANGVTASVSPAGMMLCYDFGCGEAKNEDLIVLRYADGGEYVVEGENLINISVSSASRDESTKWFAFNRLADVENITEIQVNGRWREGETASHSYELVLMSTN